MTKSKVAYVGGPMRGYERFNFPAFFRAAAQLRAVGWTVLSPAEHDHEIGFDESLNSLEGFDLKAAMRWDIEAVLQADAIYLLAGWEASEGTAVELMVAKAIGLEVIVEAEETPLQEAQRLVHGPRQAAYGHPIDNFTQTGRLWGAILNIPDISPDKIGLCMVAAKISRETNAHKRDNLTDIAGYTETVAMVHSELARRAQ